MDDKEYYSLMNRSSSWALQQTLKAKAEKKNQQNKNKSGTQNLISTQENTSYKTLEARQGRADAEMLMEKGK